MRLSGFCRDPLIISILRYWLFTDLRTCWGKSIQFKEFLDEPDSRYTYPRCSDGPIP
jgi:hypothetical protein